MAKVHKNKNINEALEFYIKLQKRRLLARQLNTESKLISADSLSVLAEFEALEDEDQAV